MCQNVEISQLTLSLYLMVKATSLRDITNLDTELYVRKKIYQLLLSIIVIA